MKILVPVVLLIVLISANITIAVQPLSEMPKTTQQRPNVLFIVVDDMADWVTYMGGHPDVITPNIDALARRGFAFTEAHVASPVCGPSRAALFTGQHTTNNGVYTNRGVLSDHIPNLRTFLNHFMDAGYRVMGAGKLFHPGSKHEGNVVLGQFHDYGPGPGIVGGPFNSRELATRNMSPVSIVDHGPGKLKAVLPMNGISTIDRPQNQYSTFDWGPVNVGDDEMPDGQVANWVVDKLHKDYSEPFFLAAGFYRPHQPFFVPQEYFDLFSRMEDIKLPDTISGDLHDVPYPGRNLATTAFTSGTHKTVSKYNQWREAVQGYLATNAFVDRQVGKLLEALRSSPYADNTLIVFWSDHGWHLGEKEHWGKLTAWRDSTRVPFIIVPHSGHDIQVPRGGAIVDSPVSSLDIYPTLMQFASLPTPSSLDGESLIPTMEDPGKHGENRRVVSTIGHGNFAVQSPRWRYIRYFDGSQELYDMRSDKHEWFNLAGDEQYQEIMLNLEKEIPVDANVERMVGFGRWKAVFERDGDVQLFDLEAPFGISEMTNLADQHPELIDDIRRRLREQKMDGRYVRLE